jgi:predicted AAA+ superfamily ATPase
VTVKEYYQILIDTLVGFYLYPISHSVRTTLVKSPKFYFFDTGVQRALTKQLSEDLEYSTSQFGRVFEHFIIKDIIHTATSLEKDYEEIAEYTEDEDIDEAE